MPPVQVEVPGEHGRQRPIGTGCSDNVSGILGVYFVTVIQCHRGVAPGATIAVDHIGKTMRQLIDNPEAFAVGLGARVRTVVDLENRNDVPGNVADL